MYAHYIASTQKNGVQQGGARYKRVWLLVALSKDILVKGTAPAEMKINTILSYACLLKKKMEKLGL